MIKFDQFITVELVESSWIDCLQRQVRVRRKAFPEIMILFTQLQEEEVVDDDKIEIIRLFQRINHFITNDGPPTNEESDEVFYSHIVQNLVYDNNEKIIFQFQCSLTLLLQ